MRQSCGRGEKLEVPRHPRQPPQGVLQLDGQRHPGGSQVPRGLLHLSYAVPRHRELELPQAAGWGCTVLPSQGCPDRGARSGTLGLPEAGRSCSICPGHRGPFTGSGTSILTSTGLQAGSGGRGGRVQDGSCWELFGLPARVC